MDKEHTERCVKRRAAKPKAIKKHKSKEVTKAQGHARQVKARAAKIKAQAKIQSFNREAAAQAQAMGFLRPPECLVAMFNKGDADLSTASRRLTTTKLHGDDAAHEQAIRDVEAAAIKANSHIGLEDIARTYGPTSGVAASPCTCAELAEPATPTLSKSKSHLIYSGILKRVHGTASPTPPLLNHFKWSQKVAGGVSVCWCLSDDNRFPHIHISGP